MTLSFDLYWSFRSPYSYLVTGRIVDLARSHDVEVRVRPVYPIAIRTPEFFDRVNPMWPPYLFRDTARIAERLGIPYHWPRPDPVVHDVERRIIAEEQPYIHRLTRLGVAAVERGHGLAFIDEVSQIIWSGAVDGWNEGEHLSLATKRAGLDLSELDVAIEANPAHFDALIAANQDAHAAAGHWGVPTMVFEDEPFFGQDRFDDLVWRLEQKGLSPR
jgi:2-hydroxychromene-2-carboxylate isomerase